MKKITNPNFSRGFWGSVLDMEQSRVKFAFAASTRKGLFRMPGRSQSAKSDAVASPKSSEPLMAHMVQMSPAAFRRRLRCVDEWGRVVGTGEGEQHG